MNRTLLVLAGIGLMYGGSLVAEPALIAERPESQTELWLQLQRDGSQASARPQSATPTERELAMRRLLESYKHPIPEFFEQDAGGQVGR